MADGILVDEARVTVLLTQLTRAIYRQTSEVRLGIRLKEFAALASLRDHSPISQQELGEILCVDANNLVIMLNDLEGAGFALRRRHPDDRRRHLVEITPAGEAAFAQAEDAIALVEGDVLSTLTDTERAKLRALLGKALSRAETGAPGTTRPRRP